MDIGLYCCKKLLEKELETSKSTKKSELTLNTGLVDLELGSSISRRIVESASSISGVPAGDKVVDLDCDWSRSSRFRRLTVFGGLVLVDLELVSSRSRRSVEFDWICSVSGGLVVVDLELGSSRSRSSVEVN